MSDFEILTVRKLADKSTGTRVRRYDPDTGSPKLVNPDTPGEDHEPWPLLGVTIEGDAPPRRTSVGMSWLNQAVTEGWAHREAEAAVTRPAGPLHSPLSKTHTFVHADYVVFHDHERGDIRYKVTLNPDKYLQLPKSGSSRRVRVVDSYKDLTEADLQRSEVIWHYELELVD